MKDWYDGFVDYVIEQWRKKGIVKDEKKTREYIDAMLWLMSNYRLKCLIGTLIDLDDIMERYE